jgi:LysR family transcriptional regulator (chromosome initiation inhibitor)
VVAAQVLRTRHRTFSAVPASGAFVEAVVAGLGCGMVPWSQAAPRIRDSELVDLDPRHPIDVPLFWQQWRLDSPALAAVALAVGTAAAKALARGTPVTNSPS